MYNWGPFDSRNARQMLVLAILATLFAHLALMPIEFKSNMAKVFEQEQSEPEKLAIKIQLDRNKAKQIVQNTKTKADAEPVEAEFLSESNQSFDKQMVAKNSGSFQEAGAGQLQDQKEVKAKQPQKSQNESLSKKVEGLRFSDLAVKQLDYEMQEEVREKQVKGSQSPIDAPAAMAQSSDFIEEIPLGDMTQLNTQEFKFYGYYHRIRQRLEQHWGSSLQESAERMYRTGRRLPANSQRITGVSVVMDERGNIIDVRVQSASGVTELDEAAIESFNRAGPFPNPPQGMIQNGRVQIEWGFVVKS
jgi:TonB family protein